MMQFSIENLYIKNADTKIKVTYNDRMLEFTIGSVIGKKNKEDLDNTVQFVLLNEYLAYKGEVFQAELFDKLCKSMDDIVATLTRAEIHPLPYHIVFPLLDHFDLNDVFLFLKNVKGLQAPSNLADTFDTSIESDGRGTRVQTYIKDDFIELAALTIIMKVVLGPLCELAYAKSKEVNSMHKEYILFQLIKKHPIYHSAPMQKLLGLVEKLIEQAGDDETQASINVLEKYLPKEEIPIHHLGSVVIQKICTAPIIGDNENKNIVTRVYNYINNKIKSPPDVRASIRPKTALTDNDGEVGEKESIVESYRLLSELSNGDVVEFNWAVDTIDKIVAQLHPNMRKYITQEVLQDAVIFCKKLESTTIQHWQVDFLKWIFKDVLDPRMIDYIKIDNIINLMAVGFTYLWNLDFKNIALLLVARLDKTESEVFSINSVVNKSRIDKELKDQLDFLYPLRKPINQQQTANVAEKAIELLTSEINNSTWLTLADDKYLIEFAGNKDNNKLMQADIRLQFTKFVIRHETLRH